MNSVILSEISGTSCNIEGIEKTGKSAAEGNPTTSSDNIPRRDSTFLVVTPVRSATYPSQPASPATLSPRSPSMTACVTSAVVEPIEKERRSSSMSSIGPFSKRYLKLVPVYGGGDPGTPDYVDIEEE